MSTYRIALALAASFVVSHVHATTVDATTGGITILVSSHSVVVNNVPAGGSIVLFMVARTTRNRHLHVAHSAKLLSDDDRDTVVSFIPEDPVPLRSVWIVADIETGSYAAAAHPDFPLHSQPLLASSFRKDSAGEIAALELEIPRLILLLVSPGKGAWILSSMEGGPGDADSAPNGKLSMLFSEAIPVAGKEKPPPRLKAGDFVAAVSPGLLDVWIAAVGK
jgi:hypothetical protein